VLEDFMEIINSDIGDIETNFWTRFNDENFSYKNIEKYPIGT
jgi:hypothetical protein